MQQLQFTYCSEVKTPAMNVLVEAKKTSITKATAPVEINVVMRSLQIDQSQD